MQKVNFRGNRTFSSSILKLVMETRGVGGLARLFGKHGPEFSDDLLSQDSAKLILFYQREGFLSVKIPPIVRSADQSGKTLVLTIPIDEGTPIKVRTVTYSHGADQLADSLLLALLRSGRDDLLLKVGQRFRDSSITMDQLTLKRMLSNAGFPYAEVAPDLKVSPEVSAVDVTWRISSGPACTFGDLRISGTSKVSAAVISRQVPIHAGDQFRLDRVEQAQRQVYSLGVFQIATATPTFDSTGASTVPVEVYVEDARRFTTKFGLGYGTEDHFRVSAEATFLGFLGGARKLQLFLKHSYLEPYHFTATVTQPGYPTPRTTLSASPFVWRQREPGFTVNRVGGSIGAQHQFSSNLSSSVTYSLEHVRVAQSVLTETLDSSGVSNLYNKSQIIFASSFDNSRPIFNPRKGFLASGSFSLSGLGFGSEVRYAKVLLDLRRYQGLAGCVLAMRMKLGGIRTLGSASFVPLEERLYSGGSSSVRGWGRSELGPLLDGVPIGGSSLLEGSVELRFPLVGILSGVLFGDFGNVWTGSFSYHPGDLRYAAGTGIRFATPIGPIRLDVARPVADTDKAVQVHISVGQAF